MSSQQRLRLEPGNELHPARLWPFPSRRNRHCLALLTLVLLVQMPVAGAAGDALAGKAAFARCASCHAVGPSARGGFGPQLNGIFGRPAAATADYNYSAALKNSGIVWSDQTLAAFLRAPGDVVPGNKMRFWGIGNDRQIADLLAYLRTFE